MDFFNSGLFWFIEGILLIITIIGLKIYLHDKNIKMNLWKWFFISGWILLFSFTIGFITTSIGENEPIAAFRGGLIFGFITLIAGLLVLKIMQK